MRHALIALVVGLAGIGAGGLMFDLTRMVATVESPPAPLVVPEWGKLQVDLVIR
jgi:hypothetical protein